MAANVDENDGLRRKKGVAMVPSSLIIIVLGWYLLLGYLTQLVADGMPRVISNADIARDNTDTFSEEAAWGYLRNILGDAPRVAGTAYHLNKTVDMKAMVDDIASQANQHVRTDWQVVSGDFYIQSAAPFVTLYENVSNIIAVLEGESGFHSNGTIGASILVNCHYDSVPFAMGASDNAVFCAVLMEVLHKLSKRTRKLNNNIVFLFNGAEEVGLLGSHGFLQHPWSKGVTSVVNLDAAGMNGKPCVFQTTDPRLLSAYRRAVSRPSAQGVGEFLFSSGIIPSDTDFRIFRDFGDIYGIDIAFTKWGHVYHTRYDHPDLIRTGVIQNAGNMMLALVQELGDMEELNTKIDPPSPAVYFDYLNVFMITYSLSAAYAVDTAVALVACLSIAYYIWLVGPRWSTVRELLYAVVGRGAALAAGVALVLAPASIMIATVSQLRYLSEPWIVVPLFWIPYLVGAVAAAEAYDAWRTTKSGLSRSIRALQAMAATRLALLLALLLLLCFRGLQSTRYLVAVPLLLTSLAALVSLTLVRYLRLQAWQHLLLEVALSTPTAMFMFSLALQMDAMMLPIMGRTPTDTPDYLVAFINIGLAALVATTVSGMELLFSRRRLWLPLSVVFAACVVIMFIPFAPFRDDGPSTQRHYWFHSEIVSYDAELRAVERSAGVAALKLDAYSGSALGALLAGRTSSHPRDCHRRVYCDLPLYRTSFGRYLPQAVFIDMEGPARFAPEPSLSARRACVGETCSYHFIMNGAAHNTLTLWPRSNVTLTGWSLRSPALPSSQLLARPVYTIIHSLGLHQRNSSIEPYHFNVTCTIPLSLQSQTAMEVSHHSHKIHHPEDFTEAYRNLLDEAPKYFNVASFLSFRHNYVF